MDSKILNPNKEPAAPGSDTYNPYEGSANSVSAHDEEIQISQEIGDESE